MRDEIRSFRDLHAWQKAFELGAAVYERTRSFPSDERFGLTIQARRSAIPVASNIAEGHGRGSRSDYLRFLRIARGSLFELDTQLRFAARFGYLAGDGLEALAVQVDTCGRVLAGLIRSLEP